ncbi:MAG: PKD domain-containing protein [Desulfobacterales bacterium]|nr:PKD domain-containing protein [Desulfobacterales bacterium]
MITWSWNFGDGNTSKEQNPTHEYKKNDIYEVSLEVTEDDENSAIATHKITITGIPPVPGDIDGDGNIDMKDAILALKTPTMSGEQSNSEQDVNGDGKIGMEEVVYILQTVSGLRLNDGRSQIKVD